MIRNKSPSPDYARLIKESVTMRDVLSVFGIYSGSQNRIPCPLHNGKDNNFSFKGNHFKCYVCGKSGTVIDFTMEYYGLPFIDAIKRLNDDLRLGLPLDRNATAEQRKQAAREAYQRRKEAQRKRAERKRLEDAYDAALDRFTLLDKQRIMCAPERPGAPVSDVYAYACQHIDEASCALDEAYAALWAFNNS